MCEIIHNSVCAEDFGLRSSVSFHAGGKPINCLHKQLSSINPIVSFQRGQMFKQFDSPNNQNYKASFFEINFKVKFDLVFGLTRKITSSQRFL